MAVDLLLRTPHRHSSHSSRNSTASSNMGSEKRTSLLGSIKGRLSRSPSANSQRSIDNDQAGSSASGQAQSSSSTEERTNRFGARAPPTRRPPPKEAPPAYSANPTIESGPTLPPSPAYQRDPSPSPSVISISTPEDPYSFLGSFDTVFVIDDSGSMAGRSWREVKTALAAITPVCVAHDKDGVDVYFLNHRSSLRAEATTGKAAGGYRNIADEPAIDRLFTTVRPGGMTPTGTRLGEVLKAYVRKYEDAVKTTGDPDASGVRPINIIMITDGVPSDDPESILINIAQRLDRLDAPMHQVGIQFFQVGREDGAREALQALDDNLARTAGVRDMVDTVTFDSKDGNVPVLTGQAILKTVLGAVHKKYDRTRLSLDARSQRNGLLRP